MSPVQATAFTPKRRREIIRDHILTKDYVQLAEMCHVSKRTIKRDVRQWRREGGFEQFLMDEFFSSYPDIKQEFPDKAFDRLCFLLGKTLTRKIEKREEIEIREEKRVIEEININVYSDAEKSILDQAARILNEKSEGKSSSIH